MAKWVFDVASKRTDAEFELVDLLDYPLPHLDEPLPPSPGQVVAWSTALASLRQPAASEA
nr:hypothetical protein [Parafrankia sp. Ea1.12]